MRVVVTGGGTGGHIFPAVAVCEAIRKIDSGGDVLYIGAISGMEKELVPQAGIPFQGVTARKMPFSLSPATVRGLLALLKGYTEARTYLKAFKTDVVAGAGGYVAAATVLAASRMKIPTVILENNFIAGRTNLKLGGSAKAICVSFNETMKQFPERNCYLTGLPLRSGTVLPAEVSQAAARQRLAGLYADRFTVLIVGGSQGSRAINEMVVGGASSLLNNNVQILHQTGPKNFDAVTMAANSHGLSEQQGYFPRAFLNAGEMPLALRAADLIVCRGGISTLSEAMVNGLPAIVIPLPTAYADHQTANARAVERIGAAICRPEADLNATLLAEEILAMVVDSNGLMKMKANCLDNGKPIAAETVARLTINQA